MERYFVVQEDNSKFRDKLRKRLSIFAVVLLQMEMDFFIV